MWPGLALVLLAVTVVGDSPRDACDCVTFPMSQADRLAAVRRDLVAADAVFVGTIGDVVDTLNSVGMRIKVDKVWKGAPGEDVVLAVGLRGGGNSCWYTPPNGRHLFFAKRDSSGWWLAHECSSTGPIENRAEVSGFLKELCQSTELCAAKGQSLLAEQLPNLACSRQRRVQ